MSDQEHTQIHFDCADVAAGWLLKLHGGDVLKARAFLNQETGIFADCVDLILCAIEDHRRQTGDITSPRTLTVCELADMIEAGE